MKQIFLMSLLTLSCHYVIEEININNYVSFNFVIVTAMCKRYKFPKNIVFCNRYIILAKFIINYS